MSTPIGTYSVRGAIVLTLGLLFFQLWPLRLLGAQEPVKKDAPPAELPYQEKFLGWSPDNTFYVATEAGTDELDRPKVCYSDLQAGAPTWPKKTMKPLDGQRCRSICGFAEEKPRCSAEDSEEKAVAKAKKWVHLPKPARQGPAKEEVKLKRVKGNLLLTILRGATQVDEVSIKLHKEDEKTPPIQSVYWRPDGGGVAVQIGRTLTAKDKEQNEGYGPAVYLAVVTFAAKSNAPAVPAAAAKDAAAPSGTDEVAATLIKLEQARSSGDVAALQSLIELPLKMVWKDNDGGGGCTVPRSKNLKDAQKAAAALVLADTFVATLRQLKGGVHAGEQDCSGDKGVDYNKGDPAIKLDGDKATVTYNVTMCEAGAPTKSYSLRRVDGSWRVSLLDDGCHY